MTVIASKLPMVSAPAIPEGTDHAGLANTSITALPGSR